MCGICGIFDFEGNADKWNDSLNQSITLLKNRGPNSDGIFFHHQVGLAHTRLAVIDTSTIASQPFTDNSGRYTIIFNGEFYNYLEHRNKLIEKGYKFRSQSDTEVLLNLFIEKGEPFLQDINGCFSLAIYDNLEESLFVARDRIGIKPMVFYTDHKKFIFSSEIKAILPFGIKKELNHDAVRMYLYLNYIPAPHTIFNNVYKLLPGHYVKIKKNQVKIEPYYQIPKPSVTENKLTFNEATEKFSFLLEESVKRRLISDVPLGTFLSGGIDSSIVTALAAKHTHKLDTFSIGFSEDPYYDETSSAQLIANKFDTHHTVFSLSRKDLFSELTTVLDYLDEPFADSSSIAVSALSRITKQNVTVALSGDGADELHAGYNKHFAHYRALQNSLFNIGAKASLPLWLLFPKSRNSSFSNKARQALRYSKGLYLTDKERYWHWCSFAHESYVNKMLVNSASSSFEKNKKDLLKDINSNFNSVLYSDMNLVLPNDMLFKVDMMSMSKGLEVRVPMLDHTVVDFVSSLPSHYKIDKNSRKKLLRSAFGNLLPNEILLKPKHGFEVPLLPWLKNDLQPLINQLLHKDEINKMGIFNFEEINHLKNKIFNVNPSESPIHLWNILVFQYWCNKYFY